MKYLMLDLKVKALVNLLKSNEEKLEFLDLLFDYIDDPKSLEKVSKNVQDIFYFIKEGIDHRVKKGDKRSKTSSDNGKKGGRPKIIKSKSKVEVKFNALKIELPNFVDPKLWIEYVKSRKVKLTDFSSKKQLEKLGGWERDLKGDANKSLEYSVSNGYVALYKPKSNQQLSLFKKPSVFDKYINKLENDKN